MCASPLADSPPCSARRSILWNTFRRENFRGTPLGVAIRSLRNVTYT